MRKLKGKKRNLIRIMRFLERKNISLLKRLSRVHLPYNINKLSFFFELLLHIFVFSFCFFLIRELALRGKFYLETNYFKHGSTNWIFKRGCNWRYTSFQNLLYPLNSSKAYPTGSLVPGDLTKDTAKYQRATVQCKGFYNPSKFT